MSYARQPPQNTPIPCPSPTVNQAQQAQAGPQAPPPQQQLQHGQAQARGQGGGQTPRPGPSQAPYVQNHTAAPHPQPHPYQQPHPQAQAVQARVRGEVVSILATTTNQCLADLGYKPGQDHARLQQLEEENTRIHDDNKKLYEDNTRLIELLSVEQRKLELMNLSQTQQVWTKTVTDLQTQIAELRNERQRYASRCSELEAHNQALQAQVASYVANPPSNAGVSPSVAERAYSDLLVNQQQLAAKLNTAEQRLQVYYAHGRTCTSFQQQYGEYVTRPAQRTPGQPQTPLPQQPYVVPGYATVQPVMSQQQHAFTQHQMQQRRASAPVLSNGQRPSQPGTPLVASPSTMNVPPGAYFGGRPVVQQNGSSSRPSSTQPGTPAHHYANSAGVAVSQMGPPQQVVSQGHVRTPSQQPQFAYMNGAAGNGMNGLPQGSLSLPGSNAGQVANVNMNSQAQAVIYLRQQQQQQQQQQAGNPPPPSARLVQQPQPSTPSSNPAPSPMPQIFSNALMHSNSHPHQQQQQQVPQNRARSRATSVVSVSSSPSRPNSAASTVQQQQQQQQQYQPIQARPQSRPQSQNRMHGVQSPMQSQQQQYMQQLQQYQLHQQSLRSQSQPYSQPSTPLVPVPPSPGTQPPPPSGSTDGSFAEYQSAVIPSGLNVPLHQVGQIGGDPTASGSTPGSGREGTPASISTPMVGKRGSVVLGGDGDEESRKKMRMSVDAPAYGSVQGQEGQVEIGGDLDTNTTNANTNTNLNAAGDATVARDASMPLVQSPVQVEAEARGAEDADEDEDEDEEEEEDAVGPDGLRTVESCLESLFATEGEKRTCRMCLKRYEKGLIPAATSFTAAEDQVLVDHCLAEHDVVWNKLRHDV